MTKLYIKTATELSVEENRTKRVLVPITDTNTDSTQALAILVDALCDEERARSLYSRFNWRVIKESPKGFRISIDKVLAVVADIEKVDRETAMGRVMVAREPAPVVSDRGAGIVWDAEHK